MLLVGVGVATVTDLQLNTVGSVLSLLAIITTCIAQIVSFQLDIYSLFSFMWHICHRIICTLQTLHVFEVVNVTKRGQSANMSIEANSSSTALFSLIYLSHKFQTTSAHSS